VIVTPRQTGDESAGQGTLDEGLLGQFPREYEGKAVPAVGFLYVIGEVAKVDATRFEPAVIAGTEGQGLTEVRPGQRTEYMDSLANDPEACEVGAKAAVQFKVRAGDLLQLRNQGRMAWCKVFAVVATGGAEDTQVFTTLKTAQKLADLDRRLSLAQLSVNATPDSLKAFISSLSQRLPNASVNGIKQFAETESRIYNRISGILSATVLLVLFLTFLCVMAGMSNVAVERKNDVGLMKAIGGSVRQVVRLFLTEAILLGVVAGLAGSAVGIATSIWLGKTVFGVAAEPQWIVYPVSVALTVITSIASAFPLRRLASIRPASVFRGAE
jgi:putative ABC transport system permease protein